MAVKIQTNFIFLGEQMAAPYSMHVPHPHRRPSLMRLMIELDYDGNRLRGAVHLFSGCARPRLKPNPTRPQGEEMVPGHALHQKG